MEDNNGPKIRMSTIVMILIVCAIVIGALFATVITLKNSDKNANNEIPIETKNTIIENRAYESKEEIEKENVIEDDEEFVRDLEADNVEFALKLLKLENKGKNMLYSPLSISYALHMLSDGANGETKEQIDNVFGINEKFAKHKNIDKVLSLANAMYIRDTFSEYVNSEYEKNLKGKYNAEVKIDKFENAKNINSWIEEKTLKQIKNLLSDDDVSNQNNELMLINALAIDMKWEIGFDFNDTYGQPFYKNNGSEIEATMMHKTAKNTGTSYYQDDEIIALTMNLKEYEDEQMEFVAILPNEDLSKYIENFDEATLKKISENSIPASEINAGIEITIPKFKYDCAIGIEDDLKLLGITDAFDKNKADLTKIASEPLHVGKVLHKANIDFSEEGIKAAAVTVVNVVGMSVGPIEEPVKITFNKPFMYIIKDKKSNEIWFVGTLYEPNLWAVDKTDYQ